MRGMYGFVIFGGLLGGRAPRERRAWVAHSARASKAGTPPPVRVEEFGRKAAGYDRVCGVDEVGRGSLAGPLVVAAVVLPKEFALELKGDSKRYSEKKREEVFEQLVSTPGLDYATIVLDVGEVDRLNVFEATMTGMRRAVKKLDADFALIDGNQEPSELAVPCLPIVKGDTKEMCISAASIIAKVSRDRMMVALESEFPQYGFAKHKGYATKAHLNAIHTSGPSPHHRRSFAPVSRMV